MKEAGRPEVLAAFTEVMRDIGLEPVSQSMQDALAGFCNGATRQRISDSLKRRLRKEFGGLVQVVGLGDVLAVRTSRGSILAFLPSRLARGKALSEQVKKVCARSAKKRERVRKDVIYAAHGAYAVGRGHFFKSMRAARVNGHFGRGTLY